MARILRMQGRVAGHFPELQRKEPRPRGGPVRDHTARPTKPFHSPNHSNLEYAARLGGEWIYC